MGRAAWQPASRRNECAPTANAASPRPHAALGNQSLQRLLRTGAIQAKLRVSEPNDSDEQEADRVADRVLRMPAPQNDPPCAACASGGALCPRCAAKRGSVVRRRSAEGGHGTGAATPDSVVTGLGPGRPLDPSTRVFFEPRFGRDFAGVRVYTEPPADGAARDLSALAFTYGNRIAFRAGRYAPHASDGRRLLAHELAHVEQQQHASEPVIHRIAYGTGTPPLWTGRTLTVAPADERDKVDQAIARVDDIVSHPDDYAECHNHYAERCPGGGAGTLASVWGSAVLWRITVGGEDALARGDVGGPNIAYTQSGYDQTVHGLAQTLMHEAGHNCGIPGGSTHWRAEQIATYCTGAGRNVITLPYFSGGPYFSESGEVESGAAFLSYRRFLGDWASGHLDLTLGADLNFITTIAEIVEAATDTPEAERLLGEFGSVMVGLRGRVSPWGGPRYGGLTGRIETGFGAGRFALRPADPAERARTSIEASWVLQIGVGAEFAIPSVFTEGAVVPLSIEAAYRLVQPLNGEAERLHGVIGGVLEIPF